MIILGLTGSIGMGKSATAQMFARRGVPVFDADAAVHRAYSPGGEAVAPLEWAFPGVTNDKGAIDRAALRKRVVHDPEALNKLESIIHPIVNSMRVAFLEKAGADGADIVVMDIPLLFETGGEKRVDAIVVATAPETVQRERVLARGQMTETELEAILAKQTPDSHKRLRADFVVNTAHGFDYAQSQVDAILEAIRSEASKKPGAEESQTCGKSSSTPKPPALISPAKTGLLRSGVLS